MPVRLGESALGTVTSAIQDALRADDSWPEKTVAYQTGMVQTIPPDREFMILTYPVKIEPVSGAAIAGGEAVYKFHLNIWLLTTIESGSFMETRLEVPLWKLLSLLAQMPQLEGVGTATRGVFEERYHGWLIEATAYVTPKLIRIERP